MSQQFCIEGGHPLKGAIAVSGSKNAALPIIAATLLAKDKCRLQNIPQIGDVLNLLELLKELGSDVEWQDNELVLGHAQVSGERSVAGFARQLRGSVLLIGPLLARFGKAAIPLPGGDRIGARPLDAHFAAFTALGAKIETKVNHMLHIEAPAGLKAGAIVLPEPSVTATENAMLAAVLAKGETIIKLAATEPHVQDLARFLRSMGAEIEGEGTNFIKVKGSGGKLLKGIRYRIISDVDEAVSLALLAASTRSEILIKNFQPQYTDLFLTKLTEAGVNFDLLSSELYIKKPKRSYKAIAKIQSGLYPKLMSDQLSPFAILATQADGTTLIHEWMYEGRLGYVIELGKMGANAILLDPHRAIIIGPTPLRGTELQSLDIRAGMTAIIAGLVAEGQTIIHDAQVIDRGYERIEQRLQKLGAQIKRIKLQ